MNSNTSGSGATPLGAAARRLSESLRDAQINPSIVVIIIILTIIFFLSGCLHLLIRCLVMRHPRRDASSIVTLTALQGQLQQLFHLHDSGVEQAFIDTLPVFFYKSVKGLKDGADCAVCLCEFDGDDRLRLLPKCSHAFHMECIDTWLLSHSTCPLCRRSLLPEDYHLHHLSLLPSAGLHGFSSRSSSLDRSAAATAAAAHVNHTGGSGRLFHDDRRSSHCSQEEDHTIDADTVTISVPAAATAVGGSVRQDTAAIRKLECSLLPRSMRRDADQSGNSGCGGELQRQQGSHSSLYLGKVVAVQLGRFRAAGTAAASVGSTSAAISGSRRSYSVGSYEYVLDPSNLEVYIAPTPSHGKSRGGRTPRRCNAAMQGVQHRSTLSECGDDDGCGGSSRRWEHLRPGVGGIFSSCTASSDANLLDISPLLLPYPPHHRHGSRMAGPRNARLKPHDALPLALCYCAGDHSQASTERRAFSFRQPIDAEAAKLKERAGSRRSLSDVEAYPSGGGGGHSFWSCGGDVEEAVSCDASAAPSSGRVSSGETVSAAARASLARRTLSWLVGMSR